jgi:hypothetical protein
MKMNPIPYHSYKRDFVQHHCWLINTTGKPNMHSPVDKAQEGNIKDMKVTYCSEGPNIKWAYLKKLHPTIHVIHALTLHVEEEFGTLSQGKKHTVPKKELDVQWLQESYKASGYRGYHDGRQINSKKDHAVDYATKGCLKLLQGKILQKWVDLWTFKRTTTERWDDLLDDNDDSRSKNEPENDEP